MEANVEYEEYRKRMEQFPCAFNLVGADKVSTAKLRAIEHNLDSELGINDGCEQEQIIKWNLLTWVRFRLGREEEASQLSRDVIESTKRRNVASLANRSFIMWQTGDEVEAIKCLENLENMKSENCFQTQLNDAEAEQAYYYSRLGGPNYLQRAINLFCALPKTPINYLRTLGLGLVYRRMTHMNIVFSSPEHLTVEDYMKRAAECLFEVADKADNRLSSQAYAQLVILRRNYPFNLSAECEDMFRGFSVEKLCEKALEHGHNIPTVLVQCGKALKSINIDKSINLLNKSIAIKEDSAAYHHLGICYKRKAENTATRYRYYQSRSEELSGQNCVGQQRVDTQVPGLSNDAPGTCGSEDRWPAGVNTLNQQTNEPAIDVMRGYERISVNSVLAPRNAKSIFLPPENTHNMYLLPEKNQSLYIPTGNSKSMDLPARQCESMYLTPRLSESMYLHPGSKQNMYLGPGNNERMYLAPGNKQSMYLPSGNNKSIYLPPGNNKSVYLKPGNKESMYLPPENNESMYLPPGNNESLYLPPGNNESMYLPPGNNESVHLPPGNNESMYLPPGNNESMYLPKENNESMYFPAGKNESMYLPSGNNKTINLPPGNNESMFLPPGSNESMYLPPGNNESLYLPPENNQRWHFPLGNNKRTLLPRNKHSTYLPPGNNQSTYLLPGNSASLYLPPGNDQSMYLPPGNNESMYLPPRSNESMYLPPGNNESLYLPPENNQRWHFPLGNNKRTLLPRNKHSTYLPPGNNQSTYLLPGNSASLYLPPGNYQSMYLPPGNNESMYLPPRSNESMYLPPGNNESLYLPPENNQHLHFPLENIKRTLPPRNKQSTYLPPGNNQSTYLLPGNSASWYLPRGNDKSMYLPPGNNESMYLPPGNNKRILLAQENFQTMGEALRNVQRIGLMPEYTQSMNYSDVNISNNNFIEITSFPGDIWRADASLESYVRRCRNVIILNKDDENVQKAQECFKKAITLANENIPAILDLGILLKDTNQINEALKQFNSITNSSNPSIMCRVVVISAYEQAGLCYLELSRSEGNDDYREMGKKKLTKAVSIAADLINTMPELRGSHKDVWVAFTTLLTEIDKEQTPENFRLIKKFKVLELAKEHGDIIDVIQKLKETGHEELTNPEIVKPALASFLQEGQPENALVYHNIVAMNPLVQGSDWWKAEPMRSLRIKVLLHAISGRLKESSDDNPTVLFQQLFEFFFGSCVGLRDPENDQQTDAASVVLGDVLYIFESDEHPDEEHIYPTVGSARFLKRLTTRLFGLEASENDKVNMVTLLL